MFYCFVIPQSLRRFLGEFPPTIQGISLLCRYLPSFCDNTFHFCVGESPNLNSVYGMFFAPNSFSFKQFTCSYVFVLLIVHWRGLFQSRLEFYTQIIPAPTSIKNMLLFAQVSQWVRTLTIMRSSNPQTFAILQMALRSCLGDYNVYDFDYDQANFRSDIMTRLFGSGDTNMNRYGSLRPPSFTTENIQVPVKLYYAEDDGYATPEVRWLLDQNLHFILFPLVHYYGT